MSEEGFVIKKVKNAVLWTYVLSDLNGGEIIGTFYAKELQKTNEKSLELMKKLREKATNCMLNGKATIIF